MQLAVTEKSHDELERTLASAAEHLPTEQALALRGRALAGMGDAKQANDNFQQALQTNPNDIGLIESAAAFYFGIHDLNQAEHLYRELLDPVLKCTPEQVNAARRQLSLVLASTGNYLKIREAQDLIDKNFDQTTCPLTDDDRRTKAMVLSELPGHSPRSDAIEILEELERKAAVTPADHWLLAELYEAAGRWPDAKREFETLINGDKPPYLAEFIRALLARNEMEEAKLWISKWAKDQPDDKSTAEFQAIILVAGGQPEQALALINKHLERDNSLPGKRWAADLITRLAVRIRNEDAAKTFYEAAEKLFREVVAVDGHETFALANFLCIRGRNSEAVGLSLTWAAENKDSDKRALR